MHRSPVAALVLLGLLLGGCESAIRPSAAARDQSGAGAPQLDDRAVFFVIGSSEPLKLTAFSKVNGSFKLDFDHSAPFSQAVASAFTKDGYLLTAGHVAQAHVLVIGMMDGEPRAASARVVFKKSFGNYGTDLAILHVEQSVDAPVPLGQFKPGINEVFALGSSHDSKLKVEVLGGKVRSATRSQASDQITLLDTDLPSWHGDSGGAVVSQDGKLIGVITGFSWVFPALRASKLVCAPDRAFVESIVADDRAKARSGSTSESAYFSP